MRTLGEQVRAYRQDKGWNAGQMADAVGTSRQNIESLEAHGNRIPKYLGALAVVMGRPVDAMLAEAGLAPRFAANMAVATAPAPGPISALAKRGQEVSIPQYDTGGAMGTGLLLRDQPGLIRSWNVSRDWIEKNLPYYTSPDNLAVVTGFGDSMVGLFNPGDPMIVDIGITSVETDGVYFFRVGEEGFVKRLQRIPGEGLLVISENRKYRDWLIKPEMDFQVFAQVLKAWNGHPL